MWTQGICASKIGSEGLSVEEIIVVLIVVLFILPVILQMQTKALALVRVIFLNKSRCGWFLSLLVLVEDGTFDTFSSSSSLLVHLHY
jgi:hypothetical protein